MLEEIQKYYANLLIVQYNGKPKANATIKVLTDLVFANMVLLQIQNGFDWKKAKGEPLDWIGKWVGVDRYINLQLYDGHNWTSLIEETGVISSEQGGYSEVSNFDTEEGGFLTPEFVAPIEAQLSDDNFKFLIGLKIIKNSISFTAKNIDDAIYNYTNGKVYTTWDLTNRKLVYHYSEDMAAIINLANYKNILPCPPTVQLQFVIEE